ncbi:MAG: hypothetical protein GX780_04895 [Campylobacteraceae bacterium]|nr:hypothetical protein [Campylobacteraceae bacterium]
MRDLLMEVFGNFTRLIILLHIVSAILLVGSLFVMRVVVAPVFEKLNDEDERLGKNLDLIRRFGYFVTPVMFVLVLASVFMNIGLGFKYGNPTMYILVHTKEAIWTFIAFNFIYMFFKYKSARKAYAAKELIEVQENIILMMNYLIPLNFVLGLIAVYLGIILRGY